MSSFSQTLRVLAWSLVLAAPLALSGCTGLSPVYGNASIGSEQMAVNYSDPTNRLERIVYQDLMLRVGKPNGSPAPTVSVKVSRSARALNNGTVTSPTDEKQVVVTASIVVSDETGRTLFSGTRSASADYTADAQALANQQAVEDAETRGAHLLADTIRLEVLAALRK